MENLEELTNKALEYFYNSEYKNALSVYYKILSYDIENSSNYYNIGLVYEFLDEYELSVSYYKKAIRIDNNIRAINNLARIYLEKINDIDIAKKYLDFAIKIKPDDAEAYHIYGNISFDNKDYKLAESYFKKSIFYDEKFFKNYYDIAKVYLELNDRTKAKEMLDKCIELKSDFSPAIELSESL